MSLLAHMQPVRFRLKSGLRQSGLFKHHGHRACGWLICLSAPIMNGWRQQYLKQRHLKDLDISARR